MRQRRTRQQPPRWLGVGGGAPGQGAVGTDDTSRVLLARQVEMAATIIMSGRRSVVVAAAALRL